MYNKEDINNLIQKTIDCPSNMNDEDIINLYDKVQEVFKSNKYTTEEKEKLHRKGQLESLAMMYDGIVSTYNKIEK